ncbi:MAG: hypothetical protein AB1801_05495 [Chloroflexota bacterium]
MKSFKASHLLGSVTLALLMLAALAISGFTIAGVQSAAGQEFIPLGARLTNVIQNGDFEHNPRSGIATYWEPYSNGQAHFGWYMEEWPEAVHSGKRSQLMEIFQVEGYAANRVMAIYQTVAVIPNANYKLTIHALLRSDAPEPLRNQGDYAMDWGIDYTGQGKYYKVEQWVTMPLSEQLRLGSAGPPGEAQHLYFQRITATVFTGNAGKIALFIRGVKVTPSGTEVNFNVDDVSLIGPYPVAPPAAAEVIPAAAPAADDTEPEQDSPPPAEEGNLPNAGSLLPRALSPGPLVLGGLVLVMLGIGAVKSLLLVKT